MDDNLYIPKLSIINSLRREILQKLEALVTLKFQRVPIKINQKTFENKPTSNVKISMLLSQIYREFDYSKLDYVDRVYIPLRCFRDMKNKDAIHVINSKFETYIYLPTVINLNYLNLLNNIMSTIVSTYKIKGFVFSSIGEIDIIKNAIGDNFDFISNYTFNVFNDYTLNELSNHKITTITLSPELNKQDIQNIKSMTNKELIVYGKLKVMTAKYCLLGGSNGCYPTCENKCNLSRR